MTAEVKVLDDTQVDGLAQLLDEAMRERREVEPLEQARGAFSLDDAYRIQRAGIEKRVARGERRLGLKLGFTSEAKRKQMNLGEPIYGELTDAMRVDDGGRLEVASGIHPEIELEDLLRHRPRAAREDLARRGAGRGGAGGRGAGDPRLALHRLPLLLAAGCSGRQLLVVEIRAVRANARRARAAARQPAHGPLRRRARARSRALVGHLRAPAALLGAALRDDGRARARAAGGLGGAGGRGHCGSGVKPGMEVRLEVEQLFPVSVRAA